ncbi:MAG: hypothetical protein ACR2MG_19800 [Pyrinomonadaceae bacterium]
MFDDSFAEFNFGKLTPHPASVLTDFAKEFLQAAIKPKSKAGIIVKDYLSRR